MARHFEVNIKNHGYLKSYPEGSLLAEIIKAENLSLPFICNGQGSCGKCRVKLTGSLPVATAVELKHISAGDLADGIRLACQVRLIGPLELDLDMEMDMDKTDRASNILQDGILDLDRIDPLWGRMIIPKPAVLSWEMLSKQLNQSFTPDISALQSLASLPKDAPELLLEYFNGRVINVCVSDADRHHKMGVAVDIGTTTLAAYLVDLGQGRIVNTASCYNPQANYGADVISRIQYADRPDGLAELQRILTSAINQLIGELVCENGLSTADIIQINFSGNSCMMHLLLKVNPAQLGRVPFEPVFKETVIVDPVKLGLTIHPQGQAFILRGIGGFIGSDISAGVLACKLTPDRRELFIDIGTNGEMILCGHGSMLACSTAAGPALEGAMISCGMLAKPGAITDVVLTKDSVIITTLNNEAPIGICGSGLLRIVVEMLRQGIITESGRFATEIDHPNFNREEQRFYLVKDTPKSVFITQKDIRQLQLAKGAIRSGAEVLLKRLGMQAAELETIYLAGAFGTFLKPADAVFLGLLPEVSLERIRAVGNTAGTGTVLTLISQTALAALEERVQKIEHIELAEDPEFSDIFADAMLFGTEPE
jgi:uncharacterized 2Fe-2S/4Fe-4S cluster protein (DUF4445 family)